MPEARLQEKRVVGVTDHDKRVYHHMYETGEGIAEHAERIAKLEELVLVLMHCADENSDCDTCSINGNQPELNPWLGCDTLREMIQELGLVNE